MAFVWYTAHVTEGCTRCIAQVYMCCIADFPLHTLYSLIVPSAVVHDHKHG